MKQCGLCAEDIQESAALCRHCGAKVVTADGLAQWVPATFDAKPASRTNNLAVVSLVASILWLYWLGSIVGLVSGIVALRQIDRSGGRQQGKGLAAAGVAVGAVGMSTYLTLVIATH
jgi:hypothetical protein